MLANAVTLSRLVFLAVAVVLLHVESVVLLIGAFFVIIITILIDAVDGTIARRRGSVTPLGSVLDIAIDRVVENVFWITFVSLELVPLWVALIVVTRGILTDAVRSFAMGQGLTAFAMMESSLGRWLVSRRFMRALYGTAKAVTFPALALLHMLHFAWTGTANATYLPLFETIASALVLITVTLTLLRGVPVLVEARRFFVGDYQENPR